MCIHTYTYLFDFWKSIFGMTWADWCMSLKILTFRFDEWKTCVFFFCLNFNPVFFFDRCVTVLLQVKTIVN